MEPENLPSTFNSQVYYLVKNTCNKYTLEYSINRAVNSAESVPRISDSFDFFFSLNIFERWNACLKMISNRKWIRKTAFKMLVKMEIYQKRLQKKKNYNAVFTYK